MMTNHDVAVAAPSDETKPERPDRLKRPGSRDCSGYGVAGSSAGVV